MTSRRWIFCLSTSILVTAACAPVGAAEYHALKEIAVGGAGGFDYLFADGANRRLYVSHGSAAVVIDLDKYSVVGEVTDTPGIHGIAIVPQLKRGFTSNGREAKVSMFDCDTLKTLAKLDAGPNPDAILFEPGQQEVYAFNGRGNSATVFDAKTGKTVATIALSGKPESGAADPQAHRVYCNIENKSEIDEIDTQSHAVLQRWPIAPGEEASGMAIDVEHHRLFIGCHNKFMEMIDSTNGKIVSSVPIGDGVDANAFDLKPNSHSAPMVKVPSPSRTKTTRPSSPSFKPSKPSEAPGP
jgi:DNA-binding beta-propeller fold protein YncE